MELPRHLTLLERAERTLTAALHHVAERHADEPDVAAASTVLADVDERRRADLAPMLARYPDRGTGRPADTHAHPPVPGDGSLLVDLQGLHVLACWVNVAWSIAGQAGRALRDEDLTALADRAGVETTRHMRWARGRLDQAAPQALVLG